MESLAIIGTGIAGMTCAHYLHKKYNITIYEKNNYVGGHTNTITVDEDGTQIYIDTGFMVFNHATYPLLTKLFKDLNVPTKPTSMSFSVQHMPSGLEYSGSGLNGLFAQRKNIFSRKYISMLGQIARFNTESVKILDDPTYQDHSIEEYIKEMKYGDDMLWKYLIPMSSAVWSTPMDKMLQFPAVTLIRFFKNHGFLGLNTQHQWYTVVNGSKTYSDIIIEPFKNSIEVNNATVQLGRTNGKAIVITKNGTKKEFDKVILACHGDEALQLLAQPTLQELQLLQPFKYQKNTATLHTDHSVMPKLKRVWSSWNYRIEQKTLHPSTTYWMNNLQHVSKSKDYFVSINDPGNIDEKKIIKRIDYTHPLFDVAAIKAQKELSLLNAMGPIYFCGSYFRYGFHEDALWSANKLCQKLNELLPV
ncbi:MAG: FAD-dependent oxidoreductase [Bacteroidetes bacterium]|nr:FAD-dependent oxidoreductase [Bacteroidota bacterium]